MVRGALLLCLWLLRRCFRTCSRRFAFACHRRHAHEAKRDLSKPEAIAVSDELGMVALADLDLGILVYTFQGQFVWRHPCTFNSSRCVRACVACVECVFGTSCCDGALHLSRVLARCSIPGLAFGPGRSLFLAGNVDGRHGVQMVEF